MIKQIFLFFSKTSRLLEYIKDKLYSSIYKKAMKSCGDRVVIRPSTSLFQGLENLSIGDDVNIPRYAHIFCTVETITIGNKVIFGPSPTIVTGGHRYDLIGRYIADIRVDEKKSSDDAPVIIEDDCWVGANVTILKGVTIGRGSIVAAGAVVTKSCPPYSIIGGVPAKILKMRFSNDEIKKHEEVLS